MCMIIVSKCGIIPPDSQIYELAIMNPHGWGIAYLRNGRTVISRGMDADRLVKVIRRVAGNPYVVHMRYATHGDVDLENTHPFSIGNGWWLFHNGIIDISITDPRRSDTYHFADLLRRARIVDPDLIERLAGPHNRIALWGPKGQIHLLGPWHRRGPVWYSTRLMSCWGGSEMGA